ncbi:unnamed protein product [Rotaria sp. Silwood1]|nr:unnamed protein product [Rotaria sp. Silwood1]
MVIERRENLSKQELNDIKKKITKIDCDLQVFGGLLTKVTSDEKKINVQHENASLSIHGNITTTQCRFTLNSCHSPYIAISEKTSMLIENDNHLVLFDERCRINEIAWQGQQNDSFTSSIKDLIHSNYLE